MVPSYGCGVVAERAAIWFFTCVRPSVHGQFALAWAVLPAVFACFASLGCDPCPVRSLDRVPFVGLVVFVGVSLASFP